MSHSCKPIALSGPKKTVLKSLLNAGVQESQVLSKLRSNDRLCDPYSHYLSTATYIVPPQTLLAYEYVQGANIPVTDQTVWVIDRYDNGYYFGTAYIALNGQPSSQRNLVGSITPSGDVYMTFFSMDGRVKDTDITTGIGKFTITPEGGYFTMQMNSAQNSPFGLAHWSYMIPVTPTDYFYQHLPSLNLSVPEFINQF
jgi:hypothetical protein